MSVSPGSIPSSLQKLIDEVLAASELSGALRDEVERDLRNHFEDGLSAGHSPAELARRFGDPVRAGRRIATARRFGQAFTDRGGPDTRWRPFTAASLWAEIRLATRALIRAPVFTAVVLTTLGLGIGANTAVFSVLDAVLLQPLPYADPDRLVRVEETWATWQDASEYTRGPSVVAMRDWDVFTGIGTLYTYRETGADLTDGDRPERIIASRVSAGFFETLGVSAALGRTFVEEESFGPGEFGSGDERAVAVLSYGLWERRFGGDRSVIGRTITLDGIGVEVLGIMPRGFVNPLGTPADLWLPQDLRVGGSNSWGNYYLTTIARLRDDVDLEAAQGRADALAAQVRETQPESGEWGVRLTSLQTDIVGPTRRSMLWLLAAAVALVLLSACVNVGNLVFARSLDRERDVALRGALGSGRGRLVANLLLENALLAAAGSVLGVVIGVAGVRILMRLAPDALPPIAQPGLSPGVFGFALAAMLAALVIFGLAPSVRLSGVPLANALRAGARSGTETGALRRVRSGLVVAQMAVALVLLVGAGLLVRSFTALQEIPIGVVPDEVSTFEVHLPGTRYPEGSDRHAFHDRFQAEIAALPGVEAVGATSWLPLRGRYHIWGQIRRLGDDVPEANRASGSGADVRVVTGDYFTSLGIPRLQGPEVSAVDPDGEAVVWLSRSLAEELFPDGDPVGAMVAAAGGERRVIGVVGDVAWNGRGGTAPTVYVPHAHFSDNRNWALTQTVRASGDPEALRAAIEAKLAGIDGSLVLFRPRPLAHFLASARAQDRFALMLMTTFALLAMTLAAVGTYGILAGAVARRTREIGIRMALGADASLVRWSVMRSALLMVCGGVVLGGLLAWSGSRWLRSLLFEVRPGDPLTYAAAVAVLLTLGLLAAYLPAHRATRIDPARCLTAE